MMKRFGGVEDDDVRGEKGQVVSRGYPARLSRVGSGSWVGGSVCVW